MEKKNDLKIIIIIILALLAVIGIQKLVYNSSASKNRMLKTIEKSNKLCPFAFDDETILDSISLKSDHTEIIFNLKLINQIKDSIDVKDFEELMTPILVKNAKTDSNLRIYRVNKMVISYTYSDKNQELITKISVDTNNSKIQ